MIVFLYDMRNYIALSSEHLVSAAHGTASGFAAASSVISRLAGAVLLVSELLIFMLDNRPNLFM